MWRDRLIRHDRRPPAVVQMRIVRLIVINVVVLVALFVVVEGAVSLLIVSRRFAERWWPADTANDAYLTLPMYRNDPNARAYWDEFRSSARQTYVDYVGWRRRDFAGRYINIVNGYRVTPGGRPDGPGLAMFGGSAMWGTGVSDQETIPAYLAERTGRGFHVRNFGEAGYNVMQDYLQFLVEVRDGRRPQLAVFYDGINDAHASCVNPGRDGATLEFARMKDKIEYRVGSEPRIADLARIVSAVLFRPRASPQYRCEDDRQADAAAATMVRTWRAIQDLGDRAGVRTYFFLQPVAYVGIPNVSYLRLDETLRGSFQRFYAHVDEQVRALGIVRYRNLSGVLTDPNVQFFIDFAHVTPAANRQIAAIIAAELDGHEH